jgi:hypothetical protein
MVGIILLLVNSSPPKKLMSEIEYSVTRFPSELKNSKYAILIDYNRPVFMKRLWVVDLKTRETVLHSHVSHAWKSGLLYARKFSNVPGSKLSCNGVFVTRGIYKSNHGKGKYRVGMNIDGLEKGINEKAFERRIVFHPGRQPFWSEGCFMTFPKNNLEIVTLTQNGSIVIVND